ncbi:hypothetical protein J2S65_004275 [Rhodococcus fascians]|nr:hypothetical protein [Rhodococcus fascians]
MSTQSGKRGSVLIHLESVDFSQPTPDSIRFVDFQRMVATLFDDRALCADRAGSGLALVSCSASFALRMEE